MRVGGHGRTGYGGRAAGPSSRARPGRTSSTRPPSSPPALAPTRPVTAGDADDGPDGSTARANCWSRTLVAPWLCAAYWVRARETALAMSAATSARSELAVTATIGASGEVAVCTSRWSVAAGTPAHTCASPSTASWVATRP